MQVILTQDVENLGSAGEMVNVKSGYGRNFLVPRGLAISATVGNKQQLEHDKQRIASQAAKLRASAQSVADRLNGMTLQFERLVGEDERMFGSVTGRDITEQLARADILLDHRKIELTQPIKALGKYEVAVKLSAGVVANLKFFVVAKAK
jgi:large subunit ribosomal protein L9